MPVPTLYPRRLMAIISIGFLLIIMQINGVVQSYPDIIKICHNFLLLSIGSQLFAQLVNRIIKNDVKQQRYFETLLMEFYGDAEKVAEYIPILESTVKLTRIVVEKYLKIYFVIFHIPILTAWTTSAIT